MSLSKFVLRAVNHCPLFNENLKEFDEVKLPTKKDVLLCCLEVWRQVGLESKRNKETAFCTVAQQVAIKLNIIWDKAFIPIVTHNSVIQLITRCYDDYISIKKTLNCKTTVRKTKDDKLTSFIEQTSKLFDIAFCKCADFSGCTCPKEKKFPVLERQFLLDQRGPRIGRIGSVDLPVTEGMIKRAERSWTVKQSSISDGSRHVFQTIYRSRYLPRKYQALVDSSIQTNAYFGLPENVLLAIMTDFQLAVRQDALNKILRARQDKAENIHHSIKYIIPQLNFEAEDYKDMILCESTDVAELSRKLCKNFNQDPNL
ncbi:hypothetical protein AVEN_71370-1 [Araneus ventricosus]|uniref:Uncharacterized protein n=1 Tax=Araneus ventricosus TaxID=182803 RepID=A0A4Y2BHL1_ARAVE|nr:hypothetical protein AVEN_71370-1 [Araneus ventricosus]